MFINKKYVSNFKSEVYKILAKYNGKNVKIVISGGSLLSLLDNPDIQKLESMSWQIYYADERVTSRIEDQNYFQSQIFLKHTAAQTFPLINDNIPMYTKAFESDIVDLALLSIGEDGHIASLFPDHKILESKELVCYIDDAPKEPATRLTITVEALNKINHIYFFIPPKNNIVKDVEEPHASISSRVNKEVTVFLSKSKKK